MDTPPTGTSRTPSKNKTSGKASVSGGLWGSPGDSSRGMSTNDSTRTVKSSYNESEIPLDFKLLRDGASCLISGHSSRLGSRIGPGMRVIHGAPGQPAG
jgi:hypothetical protein